MKINISRLFDLASLAGSKIAQEIVPLVEFLNKGFEEVVRALRNGLTFEDNFKCEVTVLKNAVHGSPIPVAPKQKGEILGIICLKLFAPGGESDSLESFSWFLKADGNVQLTPYMRLANSTKYDLTIVIFYK